MLYISDRSLWKVVDIARNADVDGQLLLEHNVARFPGRGLVSLKGLDGLFGPETIFDLQNQDMIDATVQLIQEYH
jgi:hypothetical protein